MAVALDVQDAQFLRVLQSFFGKEQVLPHLALRMICAERGELNGSGARVPDELADTVCLFTILDTEDVPHMVVEFAPDLEEVIDLQLLERNRMVQERLQSCGVRYITISKSEFTDLIEIGTKTEFMRLMHEKIELYDEALMSVAE